MARDRVVSCLARLIAPDWDQAIWYTHDGYDERIVTVMLPRWSWTGSMSYKDWHRLMQLACNALGRQPEVKVLNREPVEASV